MRVPVFLTIGFPGAERKDVLELDDDLTEEEIELCIQDWAFNYIEYGRRDEEAE